MHCCRPVTPLHLHISACWDAAAASTAAAAAAASAGAGGCTLARQDAGVALLLRRAKRLLVHLGQAGRQGSRAAAGGVRCSSGRHMPGTAWSMQPTCITFTSLRSPHYVHLSPTSAATTPPIHPNRPHRSAPAHLHQVLKAVVLDAGLQRLQAGGPQLKGMHPVAACSGR